MEQLGFYLSENKTKKLLDVGTGVGNFIFMIEQVLGDYDEIVGIDTSDHAIEIAKGYFSDHDKIKFLVMNGNHIEYPDGYFDVVSLSNSLHHFGDAKPIFSEMERVLKPGGILLIQEMISSPLSLKQESHKLIHHFSAEIDRYLGLNHENTYTKDEIEEKLSLNSSCVLQDAWVPILEDQHTFSDEEIKHIINSADQMVSRVSHSAQFSEFQQKAESIKKFIQENGFELATEYMFVLRK